MSAPRKLRVGVLVNPVAGLGGRRAFKGSDDARRLSTVLAETSWDEDGAHAFARGVAGLRRLDAKGMVVVTPQDVMGEDVVKRATVRGGPVFEVVRIRGWSKSFGETTAADTVAFVERLLGAQIDLLLFVGGDGTAIDVARAVAERVPILGLPAGVKLFSPVFAQSPEAAAEVANRLAPGFATRRVDVVDLDERSYQDGSWNVRAQAVARVPEDPFVQVGKGGGTADEAEALEDLVRWFQERREPGTTYVLGSGTTVGAIKDSLGGGSALGVDVWRDGEWLAVDADEATILDILGDEGPAKVVVSPTGQQGAVLGRGTAQISPLVLERVGLANVLVVATPKKLLGLDHLFVDTGDEELDRSFPDYLKVRTDPFTEKLFPLQRGPTHAR